VPLTYAKTTYVKIRTYVSKTTIRTIHPLELYMSGIPRFTVINSSGQFSAWFTTLFFFKMRTCVCYVLINTLLLTLFTYLFTKFYVQTTLQWYVLNWSVMNRILFFLLHYFIYFRRHLYVTCHCYWYCVLCIAAYWQLLLLNEYQSVLIYLPASLSFSLFGAVTVSVTSVT